MRPIRVLIVEDDPKIADLHRRFTERVEGFEVVGIAMDLNEAEEMTGILEPDLILLDLYFPGGDSMGLLRDIRARGLETDVILITAAREVEPLKAAMRGGVFDYIIKPVMTARFNDCLEKFRRYKERLDAAGIIEQREIDGLLHAPAPTDAPRALPKGIDGVTLDKVRAVFDSALAHLGLSAEEVGGRIGASRSTARRYLEYLVSVRFVRTDVVYGSVGRPERKYFRV